MLKTTKSTVMFMADAPNLSTINHAEEQTIVPVNNVVYEVEYPLTHTVLKLNSGLTVDYADSELEKDFKLHSGVLVGMKDGKFHIQKFDHTYATVSSMVIHRTNTYIEAGTFYAFKSRKITEQEGRYFNYIQEHVANVMLAKELFGDHLVRLLRISNPADLDIRVRLHDSSKFGKYEFEGYRQNFYPYPGKEANHAMFELAWNHHYVINDHHPEHYRDRNEKNDWYYKQMTTPAIAEMILDWCAMSIKFHNRPDHWFHKVGSQELVFDKVTSEIIYSIMNDFDSFKWEEKLEKAKGDKKVK